MLTGLLPRQLRRLRSELSWAIRIGRGTCPALLLSYALNAAMLTIVPAGIALSVRGLVNSVAQALDGVPLATTAAWPWLLVGFVMTLLASLGAVFARFLGQRLELALRGRLQQDILEHSLAMPFAQIEQPGWRNSLQRAQNAPETHVAKVFTYAADLTTKGVQALTLLLILLAIEPLLLVLLLPVGIPYLLFQWRLSRRQFDELDQRAEQERWLGYYSALPRDVEQAAEIKLLGLGPELVRRWQRIMDAFAHLRADHQRAELIGGVAFVVCSVAAIYLAMGHAVGAIVRGGLSIGDLAIFGSAAAQLRGLVEQSVVLIGGLRWELLHVQRVRELLAMPTESQRPAPPARTAAPAGTAASVPRPVGAIELRDLVFRYPGADAPTLCGLTLRIKAGETVALVGANGAGKTTLAKLLSGLYQAQAGSILIDGRDLRELDPTFLRRQVGCVFQHFGRYMASARDNIAFGDWDRLADDGAAIEAIAHRAGIHGLLAGLPQGFDTLLGRRLGLHDLSSGQWQQVAIARLIARDARILILDEPTASLDMSAEAALFEQLQVLAAGRTTLLISHRFSTVSMADRILVLDAGRIVEDGTHRQLVGQNGRYAALFGLSRRFLIADPTESATASPTHED